MTPTVIQVGPDPAMRGGIPAVIDTLLRSSLAREHRLTVVVTYRPGAPAHRMLVFARALVRLRRLLRQRSGPTLVHVHATVRGSLHRKALVIGMCRRANVPVIVQMHSGPGDLATELGRLGPLRRRWFAHELAAADRVVSVAQASALQLRERLGVTDVQVVPNPLPAPLPTLAGDTVAQHEAPVVLFLGGFANAVKGGRVLVEALPQVDAAARFVLAGPGEPPGELPQNARWTGWLDAGAKDRALREADVVVIPSTSEGFPVALLEAMSYGRAIVATTVGAIPDVITDGEDGLLVEPGDAQALATALRRLVGDRAERERLGSAARTSAAGYAPDRVAERLAAIYAEVLGRSDGAGA